MSELLLLRSDVPRSLHACIEELSHILADLPGSYGRTAQRLAAEFEARLRYTGIDEILEDGLHSRLTEFIDTVRELARAIHSSYWKSFDDSSHAWERSNACTVSCAEASTNNCIGQPGLHTQSDY